MKKLSKGFEACNIESVTIEGEKYDVANLKKSGILNKSVMLIGKDDKWNELSCSIFNVAPDVRSWVNLITTGEIPSYTLDIGITKKTEEDISGRTMRHADYMNLEEMFPDYPYYKISMLRRHISKYSSVSGYEEFKSILENLSRRKETIENYISRTTEYFIKNPKIKIMTTFNNENENVREDNLLALGLEYQSTEAVYVGHGFTVTPAEIDTYNDSQWAELIGYIEEAAFDSNFNLTEEEPVAAAETQDSPSAFESTTADTAPYAENFAESHTEASPEPEPIVPAVPEGGKKPLSIEAFGRLTPERIVELQGLKEKQEGVIIANPFVAIKDKESLKKAKAAKAALLKASTSTEKIDSDATKYLNAFKKMLSEAISPWSKLTRAAHDKQAKEITRFEDAEKKLIEEEQAAATKRTQERTKMLTDVPFEFNGSVYSVGTFYIMPSRLETATDEEFAADIAQGKAIKEALEAAAAAETEKDRVIREMAAELARLKGEPIPDQTPAAPATVEEAAAMIDAVIPPAEADAQEETTAPPPPPAATGATPTPPAPVSKPLNVSGSPAAKKSNPKYTPAEQFIMSADNNPLMVTFDREHLEIISKEPIATGFIKCREFYKFGVRDLADRVIEILNAPTQEGVKKSEEILKLCHNSKK